MSEVFRPLYGRVLTVVIGVVALLAVVFAAWQGGWTSAGQMAPWAALFSGACWATFWRPYVAVSDAGVRLVNVTRTIDVPWPALIDVQTKWALTLVTAYGRFRAWSAPAPGAHGAVRSLASGPRHAAAVDSEGGARPADLTDTPSGEAAALVRERWDALRAAGHLDNPRLERPRAAVRWHVGTAAAGLALLALGIVTLS